jgi:hypothetical protein
LAISDIDFVSFSTESGSLYMQRRLRGCFHVDVSTNYCGTFFSEPDGTCLPNTRARSRNYRY